MGSSGLGKGPLVLRAEGCYLKNTDGRGELGIQIVPEDQPVSQSASHRGAFRELIPCFSI